MKSFTLVALGFATLTGCVTMPPCSPNAEHGLECDAALGSKAAQFELAKAFEEGRGRPQDLKQAARLYALAGTPNSGTTYVYSPRVGNAPAQVLPIRTGPPQRAVPEALARLSAMYRDGRGVRRDPVKAERLLKRAQSVSVQ